MILSKLATLKIRPILAILLAPLYIGRKKKKSPIRTRTESRLFHLSAKKFSGPIATTLKINSTKNIHTKISSRIEAVSQTS